MYGDFHLIGIPKWVQVVLQLIRGAHCLMFPDDSTPRLQVPAHLKPDTKKPGWHETNRVLSLVVQVSDRRAADRTGLLRSHALTKNSRTHLPHAEPGTDAPRRHTEAQVSTRVPDEPLQLLSALRYRHRCLLAAGLRPAPGTVQKFHAVISNARPKLSLKAITQKGNFNHFLYIFQ